MASPLETLLSKYRFPTEDGAQTVTASPNVSMKVSDPAADAGLWDRKQTLLSELPQSVIDRVVKVRQEVLGIFRFKDETDDKAAREAEEAKVNWVVKAPQVKQLKSMSNVAPPADWLLRTYAKFVKPSAKWGSAPARSYMLGDFRGSPSAPILRTIDEETAKVRTQEEEIKKQQEGFRKPDGAQDPEGEVLDPEEIAKRRESEAKWIQLEQERLNVHVSWMKWMTLKGLMQKREGMPWAVNTYDAGIVSWGMGWAYFNGALPELLDAILSREEIAASKDRERCYIQKLFYLCGFKYEGGVLQVVNTTDRRVYASKSTENSAALWTLHDEPALHAMWVVAASDDLTRAAVFKAQQEVFFRLTGAIGQGRKIHTAALYAFLAHLQHWGGMGLHFIENAERLHLLENVTLPSEEGDMILAEFAFHRLYCGRNLVDTDFVQFAGYWRDMVKDAEEENTILFRPSTAFLDTKYSSLDEIASNHVVYEIGGKFLDLGHQNKFKTSNPIDQYKPRKPKEEPFKPVQHKVGKGPPDLTAYTAYGPLPSPSDQPILSTSTGKKSASVDPPGDPPPDPSRTPRVRGSTRDRMWSYRQAVGDRERD